MVQSNEHLHQHDGRRARSVLVPVHVRPVVLYTRILQPSGEIVLWHVILGRKGNSDDSMSCSNLLIVLHQFFDLLDTVFFCLRKKQNHVSFLHVWHHGK